MGTGKGALGGIRDHFAFSGFLDTVAHPGATGTRHRVLPRRVRFTDLGLASESVVMWAPRGFWDLKRAALGFSHPWQGPMPPGDVGGQVLSYQATE